MGNITSEQFWQDKSSHNFPNTKNAEFLQYKFNFDITGFSGVADLGYELFYMQF
jgi:hypothetical protein